MSDVQPPAGADLARQALNAYRASSKPSQAVRRRKPLRSVARRGDGRDPVGLGAVMDRLTTDAGWQDSVGGGTLRERWPTLCPQYAGHVEPVGYDPERRCLELRPGSPAYATQLRLLGGQLAKQINDKVGRPVVDRIKILPVGNLTPAAPARSSGTIQAPRQQPPVEPRPYGAARYADAMAAVRAHKPDWRKADPSITAAIEDQTRRMRRHRAPEAVGVDTSAEVDRFTAQARAAAASERAALHRAREEKAGRQRLDVAPLFRTA
ncbi:DciA family protein [Streptomyces sp. NPDC058657]|uniref:DciA family protein n=1 Tax=unclassified Streptomyces TaxID=2593676 RepID=UPI003669F3A3